MSCHKHLLSPTQFRRSAHDCHFGKDSDCFRGAVPGRLLFDRVGQ